MLILLIRHGETVDNVAGLYAGVTDSKLTNQGVLQASRLATHLWTQYGGLTHIFTSDLQRAARTGQAIADHQNGQGQLHGSKRGKQSADDALPLAESAESVSMTLVPVQLPVLREQDFGSLERQSWSSSKSASLLSSSPSSSNKGASTSGSVFVPPESKTAMEVRADEFIDDYLLPLLVSCHDEGEAVKASEDLDQVSTEVHPGFKIAVISHGMLLSRLWKRLLSRCTSWSRDVSLTPEAQASVGPRGLEHLGGWSNTGYLVLEIDLASSSSTITSRCDKGIKSKSRMPSTAPLTRNTSAQGSVASKLNKVPSLELKQHTDQIATAALAAPDVAAPSGVAAAAAAAAAASVPTTACTEQLPTTQVNADVNLSPPSSLNETVIESTKSLALTIAVQAVNVTDHLKGLKRTRGGVGSAAHDESQKSIDSFFKKRKVD